MTATVTGKRKKPEVDDEVTRLTNEPVNKERQLFTTKRARELTSNAEELLSMDNMKILQSEDAECSVIIDAINGIRYDWKKIDTRWKARWRRQYFTLNDGILMTSRGKLVLPVMARQIVMWMQHCGFGKFHVGREKMISAMRDYYWWPRWQRDVESFVSVCESCQLIKKRTSKREGDVRLFSETEPFSVVGIDLIVQWPEAKNGWKAVLTMIDKFTRLMELIPIASIDSSTVSVAFLTEWCFRYGFPKVILSDRGGQFVGDVGMWLAKCTGMKRAITTSYRPSTNGITERPHKDIEQKLALAAIDEFGIENWDAISDNWTGLLRAIAFDHNTSKHRAFNMRYSPLELALTKRGKIPTDECIAYWMRSITDVNEYDFNVKSGSDAIETAKLLKQLARMRSDQANELQVAYDVKKKKQLERERVKPSEYESGDAVMLRIHERTKWRSKIGPRWTSGWIIKKRVNANVYVIERVTKGKQEERIVNVAELAPMMRSEVEVTG
jgi:hypothetical protein